MFNYINSRLNLKVSLAVALVATVVFASLASLTTYWMRQGMREQMETGMANEAQLIYRAIERPMIIGDDAGTRSEFASLAKQHTDARIMMTDFKGRITYATDKALEGQTISSVQPEKDISDLTTKSLKEKVDTGLQTVSQKKNWSLRVVSIPNEAACHHCHGASKAILGSLVVMQDIDPTLTQINTRSWLIAGVSVL